MSESKDTFVFTLDDLIYESYKSRINKETVNKKSKKYINYKENKLENRSKFIYKFADNISPSYIDRICYSNHNRKKNRLLFVSFTGKQVYDDVVATIIDRKVMDVKGKVRYIIFMFAILPSLRNKGYGRLSLRKYYDFVQKKNKLTEIILHSLKTSIEFYKKIGFHQIQTNLFLQNFEGIKDNEEFVLFKFVLGKKKKTLNISSI